MPDPTVTLAAIPPHATTLERAIHRHGSNSGRCKVLSGAMVAGMLLFASGRAQMAGLPWAAGVVVLLALADAGQVALARVFTEAYNRFMAKVPLNGGPSTKAQAAGAEEWLVLPAPALGMRDAGQVLGALGSFSVWPFYGALLALVVAFHVQMAGSGGCCGEGSARLLPSAATNGAATGRSSAAHGCSAGGGCGATGGCGSGGCGASSGKGCGCGSAGADAAKTKAAPTSGKAAQPFPALNAPRSTSSPATRPATTLAPQSTAPSQAMRPLATPPPPGSGVVQLPDRGTQFPNRPARFPNQPVPPGTTAPQPRPAQPYPAIPAPPVRVPQNADPAPNVVPPSAVPQKGIPPNVVPTQNGAVQPPEAGGTRAQLPVLRAKAPDAPGPEGKPAGQP